MQELVFGARARRKRRRVQLRARIALAAWTISLLMAGSAALTQVKEPAYSLQGAIRLQSAFVAAADNQPEPEARTRPRRPSEPVERAIYFAARRYGVDRHYLRSLAWCESDLDASAHSPAGYYGLFQFDEQTWSEYGHGSIWNPFAQARTAARLLAAGEHERWPNCT